MKPESIRLAEDFLAMLAHERAASPHTLRAYRREVGNFAGRNGFRTYFRLSRSGIATRKKDRAERRECADVAEWFHGRFSPSPCVGIVPGASTPARMRNGMFSRVRTRS